MGKVKDIIYTDLLIIGGGIAGLAAALTGVEKQKVVLVQKGERGNASTSSTYLAQGGIAAALNKGDKPRYHFIDTITVGAGLCNKKAVRILVQEGLIEVNKLLRLGVFFDKDDNGISFTKEAAHSQRRILHAGDSTGAEIEKALGVSLLKKAAENLTVKENAMATKLIVKNHDCLGAKFVDKKNASQFVVFAKNTVIATGGYVQIYQNNTNTESITGDGIALAYEAGAVLQDMEFVQFHPTTLYQGDKKGLSLFLISEAVRGEGAVLRNVLRKRFMPDYHKLAELAPRDIVARAIINEMYKTNSDHVLLDFGNVKVNLRERFPQIYRRCKEAKINITKDLVPVAPAAHYSIGGIKTDINGRTNIKHLYACGEAAATGVHGANRLASNSLLEGLVFGRRAALHSLKNRQKLPQVGILNPEKIFLQKNQDVREEIKHIMWQNVGIIRSKQNLEIAQKKLAGMRQDNLDLETKNLLTCARLTVEAALKRRESRGAHFRSDYPRRSKFCQKKHIYLKKVYFS